MERVGTRDLGQKQPLQTRTLSHGPQIQTQLSLGLGDYLSQIGLWTARWLLPGGTQTGVEEVGGLGNCTADGRGKGSEEENTVM